MHRVLVLNQDFTFLGVTFWENAVTATYCGKAIVEEEYSDEIHSVSLTIKIPAVIRLKKYVRVLYERITYCSFTKHNVHLRDNWTCQYCTMKPDRRKLTIDHVIPEAKDGKDCWENCVSCCSSCNLIKDNRTPQEAGMHLIRIPSKPRGFKEILRIKIGEIHSLWYRYLGLKEE